MPSHLDPARFAQAIVLESADIPADMTIAQWRARKALDAHAASLPRRAARRARRPRRRAR